MSSPEINMTLIARYLSLEADQNEIREVEKWVSLSEENKKEFERIKETWEKASAYAGMHMWNVEKRKAEFLRKIYEIERAERVRTDNSQISRIRFVKEIFKYAAAIIIIIGITTVIARNLGRDKTANGLTAISAARGSKTEMTLADGSKVWLNAGSTLSYESNYNNKDRELILRGEAYFEVNHNPSKPFRVHAGSLVVEAVGTVFNVKAYPDENVIETTLVEGKISVLADGATENKIFLTPNEQANFYIHDEKGKEADRFLILKGINASQNISWINDQLIISNESLESLAIKLERKYDVAFHFEENSLKQLRYTGTLNNETIEQVLEILKISSPLGYKIEKRDVWIYPEKK